MDPVNTVSDGQLLRRAEKAAEGSLRWTLSVGGPEEQEGQTLEEEKLKEQLIFS